MLAAWFRRMPVRLAALMLVISAPLVISHSVNTASQARLSREAAEERLQQAAELMANRVDDWLEGATMLFIGLEEPVRRRWADRPAVDSVLAFAAASTSRRFANFFVLDTLGRNRGSGLVTPDRDTIDYAGRDYFGQALRSTGTIVGLPRRSFVLPDRPWVVVFARALRDPSGRAYGVIASPVRLDTLTDFVRIAAFREAPLVTVVDTSGVVVARSAAPDSFIGRRLEDVGVRMPTNGAARFSVRTEADGMPYLTATVAARRAPWLVTVGMRLDSFEAPLREQGRKDFLLSLFAIMAATTGAIVLGGRILRPIDALTDDAKRIADGTLDHRSRVTGPLEVEMVRDAINRMAESAERRNTALADNERRYRFLFEANPLPMWAWNADTMEILAVNDATLEHYGYTREQLLGHPITTLLDPSEHERFSQRRLPFTGERQRAGTWRHRTADGRVVEMEVITTSSRRLGESSWLSVGIDVSARREAERALAQSEAQLRQAQKMDAVGAFAGGIAHDFNNILTGILGFCELALRELASSHPVRRDLVEMRSLAERGAALTRQILAVSRKQVLQPSLLDLNAIVADLGRLFDRIVGEDVRIDTSYATTLPPIVVDPGQLEQVLLNLVANARDAMPAGGTLTISTQALAPEQATAFGLEPRRWVMLLVRDTGVGMTPAIRERVFEPFFTTKPRGKGTGLGLALAYALLQQAGGVILCESEPGAGSTFRLFFPAAHASVQPAGTPGEERDGSTRGTETILLAEDEEAVRVVTKAALEQEGYRVLAATSGEEALATLRAFHGTVDLLLSDVVMPGMHGRELAEQLQQERPGLRVLFVSGYTDDAVLLRGVRIDETPFLAKPFTPAQLVRKVRDVLDSPPIAIADASRPTGEHAAPRA
jgi:PAS domain S-box-containing protein